MHFFRSYATENAERRQVSPPVRRLAVTCAAIISCIALTNLSPSRASKPSRSQKLFQSQQELLEQWQDYDGGVPGEAWVVNDGILHLRKTDPALRGGQMLSRKEYGDFELEFEFKNTQKGNSGIKYRVSKHSDRWLGFEYQIYDEASFKDVPPRGVTGAIYDLYEPSVEKKLHPPGEWNHAKIVAKGSALEHWLNGVLIAKAELGSPEWDKRYSESKFNDTPGFGRNSRGKLMITDHGSSVWLRNVTISEIEESTIAKSE